MNRAEIARNCESMFGRIDWSCMLTGMATFQWPIIVSDDRPLTAQRVRVANPRLTATDAEIFLQTQL